MKTYRISAFGLSDSEQIMLKSVLRLAADQLEKTWQLVTDQDFDFAIYNFDSEAAELAWQNRGNQLTAAFSHQRKTHRAVDVILKKPLRAGELANILNFVSQQLEQRYSAQPETAESAAVIDDASWLLRLSKQLIQRFRPESNRPLLQFELPTQFSPQTAALVDPDKLRRWTEQLSGDSTQKINSLLTNLQTTNQTQLKAAKRLQINEIYRQAIEDTLFARDIAAVKRDFSVSSDHLKTINRMTSLLDELSLAYQLIAHEDIDAGHFPETHRRLLFCLNRICEANCLSCLHACHHYRPAPVFKIRQCHQIWVYLEYAGCLGRNVRLSAGLQAGDFHCVYCRLMLLLICDPFSLNRFEAFRLYRLLEPVAGYVEISPFTQRDLTLKNAFLLTGHFCLDCDSHEPPSAMARTTSDRLNHPATRHFVTSEVSKNLEAMLSDSYMDRLDQQIIKRILPRITGNYERKFHRLNQIPPRQIGLIFGLTQIHDHLLNPVTVNADWKLLNQGSGGMLVCLNGDSQLPIQIGTLIAVAEPGIPVKIATARWLQTQPGGNTHIGLELCPGLPAAKFCGSAEQSQQQKLIELTDKDNALNTSFFAEKGVYIPDKALPVFDQAGQCSSLTMAGFITSTLDYDHFICRRRPQHKFH